MYFQLRNRWLKKYDVVLKKCSQKFIGFSIENSWLKKLDFALQALAEELDLELKELAQKISDFGLWTYFVEIKFTQKELTQQSDLIFEITLRKISDLNLNV